MEQDRRWQGVPLHRVKVHREYSTYHQHLWGLGFFVSLCVLYAVMMYIDTGYAIPHPVYTLVVLGYMLYVLIYKRRYHLFLAEDGLYVVRGGRAVRIPWEKIVKVRHEMSFRTNQFELVFVPDLVDEATGTPFTWQDQNELRIQYNQRADRCLRRHVPVQVKNNMVHVK